MNLWPRLRPLVLLIIFVATLDVASDLLLTRRPLERSLPAVDFPKEPPPGWQVLSDPLGTVQPNLARYRLTHGSLAVDLELQFIANLQVHYVRNPLLELRFLPRGHLPLDAGMRFYVNSRRRVIANLHDDPPSEALVESHETAPGASYGLWVEKQRRHLSTIVTSAGDAAMTPRQVARSLYLDHLTAGRVFDWLRGRAVLPDRRCVLVHLSVPVGALPPEEGQHALEEAWSDWRTHYSPVFRQ
jgi:cyanosortase A-associated protein